MVDAYNEDSPVGGDLVEIPEEFRAIKGRMNTQFPTKMSKELPVQKIQPPSGTSGSSASGSFSINLSNGTYHYLRIVSDVTFSISAPTVESGYVLFFVLRVVNGGNHTVTWPSGTRWPRGDIPTLTEDGTDMLVFYKPYPAASFWEGIHVGINMRAPD